MNLLTAIEQHVLHYEAMYRLGIFASVFTTMAGLELLRPARALKLHKTSRWTANIGLMVLNSLVLRLLFPFALAGVSAYAQTRGFGLFNLLTLPVWFSALISVVILDLLIYGQHVLAHHWPPLWRLHRVHHADLDFDLTTGARFHTLEIVFSFCLKVLAVFLLGVPVVAVVLFEIILSSMALFNHSNISLPQGLERLVRPVLVTPDMHRVHHSVIVRETNSNYGFNLSIWDRFFCTYRAKAEGELKIGLKEFQDSKISNGLLGMLRMPFKP